VTIPQYKTDPESQGHTVGIPWLAPGKLPGAGPPALIQPPSLGTSLHSGLAISAAEEEGGASERAIMEQTRHRSLKQVRRYIRRGSLFKDKAAGQQRTVMVFDYRSKEVATIAGRAVMTITLRPEHEKAVAQAIQSGAYQNPDEVIARALEVLRAEDEWLSNQKDAIAGKIDRAFGQFEKGDFLSSPASQADMARRKTEWLGKQKS